MTVSRSGRRDGGGAIAVIQANYTDLLPGDVDPTHYCIARLRESSEIGRIVLAVPDTADNQVLRDLADRWRIDAYLGAEFDVVRRLIDATQQVSVSEDVVIARVLLNRFYLDIELVDRMIALLRSSGSDFVLLPYDFDINFGADVLTLKCLRSVDRLLVGPDSAHARFRPWLFIEDHPDIFRTTTCVEVPSYPRSVLARIRSSGLFSERDCGTCSTFTYDLLRDSLDATDVVLDIASGTGEGSDILAQKCRHVRGADLSDEVVREARRTYRRPNLEFDVQDGCALSYPDGAFTAVVSSNTLEHVEDDALLLANFHRVLTPGGKLIVETPLLRGRPFNFPLLSSHVREYEKGALLDLIARCGFVVEKALGMNRGMYVSWDRAREAALVHARRP
jgi:SAM-dependent methyltransferase